MARSFPVRRPDPEADRPRPGVVAAVATGCLLLGLCGARATLRSVEADSAATGTDPAGDVESPAASGSGPGADHEGGTGAEDRPEAEAGRGTEAGAETGAETGAEAEAEAGPEAGAETGAGAEAETGIETEVGRERVPGAAPVGTPGGAPASRAIRRGRLAYLRCDGAERPDLGPFPCPRDRDLERTVWAAIDALAACPTAPAGPGPADLRLTFQPGATPEVGFLDRAGDLDSRRLAGCLAGPLADATTTLTADYLLVSFRFELVSAD